MGHGTCPHVPAGETNPNGCSWCGQTCGNEKVRYFGTARENYSYCGLPAGHSGRHRSTDDGTSWVTPSTQFPWM